MRVELPLLSIISLCVLIFFGFQGDVELYSWEVGIDISHDEARVMVDPVWAIWVPQSVVYSIGCNAFAYGNVMVLGEQWRDNRYGNYLLVHEGNHVEQFRALGMSIWVTQFFINIEPPKNIMTDWNDPNQCNRTMWLPPISWVNQWHFVSLDCLIR